MFFRYFFLCYYILFTFVRTKVQSLSILVESEIKSVIFHRAIVTQQLLELTLHSFGIVHSLRHSRSTDPSAFKGGF